MRSNLSAKPAVNKPEMPALNAYTDTTIPNWFGCKPSDFIKKSPKGDITIKSSITENWVMANKAIASFWYDVKGTVFFIEMI